MKYDLDTSLGLFTNAKYFAVLLSKCGYKEITKYVLLHKQDDSFFLSLSETLACELLTKNSKVILGRSLILKRPFDHDSIWSTEAHLWLSVMSCWSTLVDTFKESEHWKNTQL